MGRTILKMDSRLRGNDREASYSSWLPLYQGFQLAVLHTLTRQRAI